MQRNYTDRESYGPEFDDRLIKLVKANPAIYDVSHPHYRRNPVRIAIWEHISGELGASSRFLQTKWKNIRYNYLQEIKCLETGQPNANVRKRRFTEDLSFLQHTAQTYNVKKAQSYKTSTYNSSDNDSNSYMYPDPEPEMPHGTNAFEVIEIEHSDEDNGNEYADHEYYDSGNTNCSLNNLRTFHAGEQADDWADNKILPELLVTLNKPGEAAPDVTIEQKPIIDKSPTHSFRSNTSSPLLTPIVVMGNASDEQQDQTNQQPTTNTRIVGNGKSSTNGEITIERINKWNKRPAMSVSEIVANATKRKSMPAPLPALTPINDPIELYCLSLVDSLRSMPRSERERVKFEFANILKDARYKDQT